MLPGLTGDVIENGPVGRVLGFEQCPARFPALRQAGVAEIGQPPQRKRGKTGAVGRIEPARDLGPPRRAADVRVGDKGSQAGLVVNQEGREVEQEGAVPVGRSPVDQLGWVADDLVLAEIVVQPAKGYAGIIVDDGHAICPDVIGDLDKRLDHGQVVGAQTEQVLVSLVDTARDAGAIKAIVLAGKRAATKCLGPLKDVMLIQDVLHQGIVADQCFGQRLAFQRHAADVISYGNVLFEQLGQNDPGSDLEPVPGQKGQDASLVGFDLLDEIVSIAALKAVAVRAGEPGTRVGHRPARQVAKGGMGLQSPLEFGKVHLGPPKSCRVRIIPQSSRISKVIQVQELSWQRLGHNPG